MTSVILFALIACGDSNTNTPESTASTENTTQTTTNTDPNSSKTKEPTKTPNNAKKPKAKTGGMPDLLAGLATTGCDNGPGVFGAADYFHNTFTISDGSVSGTETWILHANKKLKAKWDAAGIASPCKVTWHLKGTTQSATGKGDLGLNLINNLTDTTCPKEMVNKYEDTGKKIVYNVARNADGTAQFYFPSGKFVGQGHHKGDNLQFITNKSCRWF